MKSLLFFCLLFCSSILFSQDSTGVVDNNPSPKYWKLKSTYGLNATQSSFVNWSAGGRSSVGMLSFIDATALYQKKRIKWDNALGLAFGGVYYFDKGDMNSNFAKTDDKINISSDLAYELKGDWFVNLMTSFKTQFTDGFNFPNDSVRISNFMAPGYLNISVGIEYFYDKVLTVSLSPFAGKLTWVADQDLANLGSFGVRAAEYDTAGVLLVPGEKFRYQIGAYFKLKYDNDITDNINFKTSIELFSDYLYKPENIDVNADFSFTFKFNDWFNSSIQAALIYDDDIPVTDSNGNIGPRTQFRSVIGLGIAYTVRNFKEEK